MRCVIGVDSRYHFFNERGKRIKQPTNFTDWSECEPSEALLKASLTQNKLATDLKLIDALSQLQQVHNLIILNTKPKILNNTGELYLLRTQLQAHDDMLKKLYTELGNLSGSEIKSHFIQRIKKLEEERATTYQEYLKFKDADDKAPLVERVSEVNNLESQLDQILKEIEQSQVDLATLSDTFKSVLATNDTLVEQVEAFRKAKSTLELVEAIKQLTTSQDRVETVLQQVQQQQAHHNALLHRKTKLIKQLLNYRALVSSNYLSLLQDQKMFIVADDKRQKLIDKLQTIQNKLTKDIEMLKAGLKTRPKSSLQLQRIEDLYQGMQRCKFDKDYDLCVANLVLMNIK